MNFPTSDGWELLSLVVDSLIERSDYIMKNNVHRNTSETVKKKLMRTLNTYRRYTECYITFLVHYIRKTMTFEGIRFLIYSLHKIIKTNGEGNGLYTLVTIDVYHATQLPMDIAKIILSYSQPPIEFSSYEPLPNRPHFTVPVNSSGYNGLMLLLKHSILLYRTDIYTLLLTLMREFNMYSVVYDRTFYVRTVSSILQTFCTDKYPMISFDNIFERWGNDNISLDTKEQFMGLAQTYNPKAFVRIPNTGDINGRLLVCELIERLSIGKSKQRNVKRQRIE
jgi:hypothetical protein